jgi:hypothetical protein
MSFDEARAAEANVLDRRGAANEKTDGKGELS